MPIKNFIALLSLVAIAYSGAAATIDSANKTANVDFQQIKNVAYFSKIADGKRIVFLGEEDHSVSEFNQLKTQLISAYRAKEKKLVLLFESPVDAIFLTAKDNNKSFLLADGKAKICPMWINTETQDIWRDSEEGHSFLIGGIDPQDFDQTYTVYHETPFYQYFKSNHFWSDSLNERLLYLDSIRFTLRVQRTEIYKCVRVRELKPRDARSAAFKNYISSCKQLLAEYEKLIASLPMPHSNNEKIEKLIVRNRPWEIEVSVATKTYGQTRNEMMARNLSYLADSVFADSKIIIWAHDEHIIKRNQRDHFEGSICPYLSESFLDSSAVFLLKTNCVTKNNGKLSDKPEIATSATIHEELAAGGEDRFFSYLTDDALWGRSFKRCYLSTRVCKSRYRPEEVCDGIFYIQNTHEPHYLGRFKRG